MIQTKKILGTLLFVLSVSLAFGQFYNGHQMTFGKNRVQYEDFYWQFFRFERFDTYFYVDGRNLALQTAKIAERKLREVENFFEHTLEHRIIFIIYNRHSDFKQSNIGLVTGAEQTNIGGVTRIIENKVFLYFEGDHQKFEEQITAAIAQVIFTDMMYGGSFRDKVASSTVLNIPEWYEKGLYSYVAKRWSVEIENKVKDGILSGRYKKFSRLQGEDAVLAGHAIWKFIDETFGRSVISNIVYMTRINKNPESGFVYVLGQSSKDIAYQWFEYYKDKYARQDEARNFPSSKQIVKRPKNNTHYYQIKVSPNGKYVAYATNQLGRYKVKLYNTETGKRKTILKRGNRIDRPTDYSFPQLSWHPSSDLLAILSEHKGKIITMLYDVQEEKFDKSLFEGVEYREIFYFDKVLDFSYSPDGLKYAISGVHQGQTDIYVHHLSANTNEQLTDDMADDFNPRFVNQGRQIVFSSNRTSDTLRFESEDSLRVPTGETHDLFVYDYASKSPVLTRLTQTPYEQEKHPSEIDKDSYVFLSDKSGIINRYEVKYDSTISHVDTTVHYRYFSERYPLTNYARNINDYDVNGNYGISGEIMFHNGRYHSYYDQFDTGKKTFSQELPKTEFRENQVAEWIQQDTLQARQRRKELERRRKKSEQKVDTANLMHPDSVLVNINNYVFERELQNPYHAVMNQGRDTLEVMKSKKDTSSIPKQRIYLTAFYTNQLVSQVDFSFLNYSYQTFTGGEVYFNPGFNVLMKVGTQDLFENYRITGGFRLSGNFDSNEYLLSFEDLKKRLDKQIIFHRQAFTNIHPNEYYEQKVHKHEAFYIASYPFSEVASLRGTASLRYDRYLWQSKDLQSLIQPVSNKYWAHAKTEYIYDNTRQIDVNIREGTRLKLFGEYYHEISGGNTDLWVLGADIRHYIKIHRNLILAARFATSTSFGRSKLVYYLGAVDNWINFSSEVSTFNRGIPIDYDNNYAFQTVASNMRGFTQNIRNGNNFALINTELRWPFVKYFVNRPMSSEFFRTLQVVGFFDAGSAWTGLSPFDKESAYNREVVENGPITVTVNKNRSPLVAGFGFGFRARVFGYFIRTDWAWGIENNQILPRIFYLSLNLDF